MDSPFLDIFSPNLSAFKENNLVLPSPVRSRELDLMIFIGPFQHEMFCGST